MVVSVAFVIAGLCFVVLGLTFLSVIGLLIAAPMIAASLYFFKADIRVSATEEVVVGRADEKEWGSWSRDLQYG